MTVAVTCNRRPMAPRAASIMSSRDRVLNVQHPVNLRHVPTEAAGQLRLADALVSHPLIQHHLHRSQSWQYGVGLAARRCWNILAIVDAGRYGLFKRVDSAGDGLLPVVSEGGQLREVGGGRQDGPVIIFESYRIGKHQSNPKPFLIFATSPRPDSFPPPCIGSWLVRSPSRTVRCPLPPLVGVESAALLPQPASTLPCAHPVHTMHNISVIVNVRVTASQARLSPLPRRERRAP